MRESLERAIRAAPLNARHISLLGLVAERAGDVSRAREMMAAAARLSHRDTVALDG